MASTEQSPLRALIIALAAMVAVALLLGAVVGGAVMAAMNVTGLGEEGGTSQEAPATLSMPSYTPTESPDAASASESATPTRRAKPKRPPITLFMAPQRVPAGGRINVNGVYPKAETGSSLQIQRFEGGTWTDFPVEARVSEDSFDTWIQTSRTGKARFRVVDLANGKRSNVAVVTIG